MHEGKSFWSASNGSRRSYPKNFISCNKLKDLRWEFLNGSLPPLSVCILSKPAYRPGWGWRRGDAPPNELHAANLFLCCHTSCMQIATHLPPTVQVGYEDEKYSCCFCFRLFPPEIEIFLCFVLLNITPAFPWKRGGRDLSFTCFFCLEPFFCFQKIENAFLQLFILFQSKLEYRHSRVAFGKKATRMNGPDYDRQHLHADQTKIFSKNKLKQ